MVPKPCKMRKYSLLCLIVSLMILSSTAIAVPCGKIIVMTVTRGDTVFAVPGAAVRLEGASLSAISDKNGKVFFDNVPVGEYSINASAISDMVCLTVTTKGVKVNQDLTTLVEVVLGRQADSIPGSDVKPAHRNISGINTIDIKLGGDPLAHSNESIGTQQIAVDMDGYLFPRYIKTLKYFVSGQLDRQKYADGWNLLPHTNNEFYSGQGELTYSKSPFNFAVGGSVTRNQYGYYNTLFKYDLDHYASQLNKNKRLNASFRHEISKDISYGLSYSRTKINSTVGVRKGYPGGYQGWFSDYEFNQPYPHAWFTDPENPFYTGDTLQGYLDFNKDDPNINPYGVAQFFYTGDYPRYLEWQYANNMYQVDFNFKINRTNSLAAVFESRSNDETSINTLYPSSGVIDTSSGLVKVFYTFMPEETSNKPTEYGIRLTDAIVFDRLRARVGLRYDVRKFTTYNSDYLPSQPYEEIYLDSIKHYYSPKLDISMSLANQTELLLSYDRHFLNPEYKYLRSEPFNLGPQEIANLRDQYMLAQVTDVFAAEVIGKHSKYIEARLGWQYQKFDGVAEVKKYDTPSDPLFLACTRNRGTLQTLETKVDIGPFKHLRGYFDYTLSWAKTTEAAKEMYINYGTELVYVPEATYYSDFDQRKRFISLISFDLGRKEGPRIFGSRLFENMTIALKHTIASGLPYTRTDINGHQLEKTNSSRMPSINYTDASLSRKITALGVNFSFNAEITNIFNKKNAIYVDPGIYLSDGEEYWWLQIYATPIPRYFINGEPNPFYSEKADINRDDYISAEEHYNAVVKAYNDIKNDLNDGRAFGDGLQAKVWLEMSF